MTNFIDEQNAEEGSRMHDEQLRAKHQSALQSVLTNLGEIVDLEQLAFQCERIAREHGWWEMEEKGEQRNMGEVLMLVTTELAEAYEEFRDNRELDLIYTVSNGNDYEIVQGAEHDPSYNHAIKPEGFMVEIADVLIRLLDFIHHYKLTPVLIRALRLKLAYNETRPYRHGGKAS